MSEPTKHELVEKALETYTSIEEMKAHVKDIAEAIPCALSTVYKVINQLAQSKDLRALPESREPVVKIEEGEETELPEEEEEEAPPEEPEEELPEELEEEEEKPEVPEEEKKLRLPITVKMTKTIVELPFRKAAKWTGCADIELDAKEANDLAEAWQPVLEYYLPDILEEYFPLLFAGYVTVMIVTDKATVYKEWKEAKKAKEEAPKPVTETVTSPEPEVPQISSEELLRRKQQQPSFMKRLGA